MFNIVLYEPEIPPNTGNVIRLCANTGAKLHLIKPLGFEIDDTKLKRAGLDYHEWASLQVHDDLEACLNFVKCQNGLLRVYAFTSKGDVQYDKPAYQPNDVFLFGPETRGLPKDVLTENYIEAKVFLPQLTAGRSLNLSNTVAIGLYEALRQQHFHFV
jgi:tRNA (cytidine/uridine-2'-O-)-methyltransferase